MTNKHDSVWNHVIMDMVARNEFGAKKYNRYLLPNDGRDSLQDLYEELLDAAVYIKKLMMERNSNNERK